MLNCEYCDYLKSGKKGTCSCEFSGYQFLMGDFSRDMEYPCKDISFEDYLLSDPSINNGLNTSDDDWKLVYSKKHPVTVKEKLPIAG